MRARIQENYLNLLLNLPVSLPTIQADQDKIKQVLINLISNAIKYTPAGGAITLAARADTKSLIISVTDTGCGIPPENLGGLFQKFYRVPGYEQMAEGTGLGLYICKRIVEAHQGIITAQSEVGKGTTFLIRLPLQSPSV
jgi:signal transduction histidine kinase